jgi:hypothetical protein
MHLCMPPPQPRGRSGKGRKRAALTAVPLALHECVPPAVFPLLLRRWDADREGGKRGAGAERQPPPAVLFAGNSAECPAAREEGQSTCGHHKRGNCAELMLARLSNAVSMQCLRQGRD